MQVVWVFPLRVGEYEMKRKYLSYEETKQILSFDILKEKLKHNTYREIATEYGMDERIVSRLAQKEYNIPKHYQTIRKNANADKVIDFNELELIDLYINKQMSIRQIADFYNINHGTVSKKLKDMNIEIRPFNYSSYYNNRKKHNVLKYIDSSGYYMLVIEGEFIREHRYIMEQHLGRKLVDDEIVHHIDLCRLNNDIDNLFLFETNQYHILYHNFIDNNNYISPDDFLNNYKWIIDKICSYDFLYNLYINHRMSANAINQYILNEYNFDLDRNTIVKNLKKYFIYDLLSPTINQYDDRTCINEIRSKCS